MEGYLELQAGYTMHRLWRAILNRRDADGDPVPCSEDEMERILESEANNFMGFFIHSLTSMSSKFMKQRFYLSFFTRYHGLSGYGQEVVAGMGYMTPLSSYKEELKNTIMERRLLTRCVEINALPNPMTTPHEPPQTHASISGTQKTNHILSGSTTSPRSTARRTLRFGVARTICVTGLESQSARQRNP